MDFDIETSYLVNLDRLKEKLRWPHIVKEKTDYGETVFCIKPEHPEGAQINLFLSGDDDDIHTIGIEGVTHWHLDSGYTGSWRWRTLWENLKTVRDFIAGRLCGVEAKRADGQELFGGIGLADGWDDLGQIWEYYCLPVEEGAHGDLTSPDGRRWRAPIIRRSYFNRPPSDEQPDWSVFIPTKQGWASPGKRDELLYHQITLGGNIWLFDEVPEPFTKGYWPEFEDPEGEWLGFNGKRYSPPPELLNPSGSPTAGSESLDPQRYRAFRRGWLLQEQFELALALEDKLKMRLKDRLCGWHDREFEREFEDDDDDD